MFKAIRLLSFVLKLFKHLFKNSIFLAFCFHIFLNVEIAKEVCIRVIDNFAWHMQVFIQRH